MNWRLPSRTQRRIFPVVCAGFRRRARGGAQCARGGRGRHQRLSDRLTLRNATIRDGFVSHVTVTDPQHPLFGNRLAVLGERSGRGSAFVVVELADGRRRSIRISCTDRPVISRRPGSTAGTGAAPAPSGTSSSTPSRLPVWPTSIRTASGRPWRDWRPNLQVSGGVQGLVPKPWPRERPTTFSSYGDVAGHRQAEIIRSLGKPEQRAGT